jgi:hypothetical protein
VELRWTSSAGPATVYRVEIQRSISDRGPWSLADIAEVAPASEISTGYRVPPRILGARAYRHWRWRVGQHADDRSLRYSAWHRFSLE